MKLENNTLLISEGVWYPTILREVKKSTNALQPIFEAVTNSFEAIALQKDSNFNAEITVKLYFSTTLFGERAFDRIIIEDTGIGFNDAEFNRFLTYKDDRKGFRNRGSGRIQLLHSFNSCEFTSIYQKDGLYFERKFIFSSLPAYLNQNAIVFLQHTKETSENTSGTKLVMAGLKNPKDAPSFAITGQNLKEILIEHYIEYLCAHKKNIPAFKIETYINGEIDEQLKIEESDIPDIDSSRNFDLTYQELDPLTQNLKDSDQKEQFTIHAFKIAKFQLAKNAIKLTSKGELVENNDFKINLNVLSADDHIDKERFLFLISSPFIDARDQDVRGDLNLYSRDKYKADPFRGDEPQIFLDDIEKAANENIMTMYDGIVQKNTEKIERIEQLKNMFLLNDAYIHDIAISINDTEEKVLEKVYTAESKQIARGDAEIKRQIDTISALDPSDSTYHNKLKDLVDKFVMEIPHQNRAALTHYVARRKLVLDLFEKILKRGLHVQQTGRNEDEKLLHNLLFKQRSNETNTSDLWILNEDFILFHGASEFELMNIEINGDRIFREQFSMEEQRFINSLNEKRLEKRPDVLLFPSEGKCIILEFKSPKVNISDHLTEINNYAALILNFTKSEFNFDTFYGYLIGESIEPDDVRFSDADFKHSFHFDYLFRPAKAIVGKYKGKDGSLYTEVVKYSALWNRAMKRNEVFTQKLLQNRNDSKNSNQPSKK